MRSNIKGLLGFYSALGSLMPEPDRNDLKSGFRLEPIEMPENADRYEIEAGYYNLFKDGKKVSDKVFRRGGVGSGFKDGYCQLIVYDYPKDTMGKHCIVNEDGKIVLTQENRLDYLYHLKGCIATMKENYFNLKTGKIIARGSSNISSADYLFVEHRYEYNKENPMETGVYKINYHTGEVEFFKGRKR